MSILLWPIAIVVFLLWSLVAWIAYGLSDWAAGLVAAGAAGILSADLGPWAAWLLASLGDLVQIGVVIAWLAIGALILASPMLVRRTLSSRVDTYGYRHDGYDRHHAYDDDRRGYSRDDGWRKGRGMDDLRELRHLAEDMVSRYRGKRWTKKGWKKWDD